jgi:hypothetical protein
MMRDMRILVGAALVGGVLIAGCSKKDASADPNGAAAQPGSALPQGHPDVSSSTAKPPLKGVVKETMDAGGYTYARLDVGGNDVWAAGPATKLTVGDTVTISAAMPMQNYTSPTLKRTFARIYFTEGFLKPGQSAAEGAAGPGQGVVLSTIDAGQYTYIQVNSGGSQIWLAAPTTKLEKGQSIGWTGGTPMKNFQSKTLNRTFESILFVGKVTTAPTTSGT